MLVGAPAASMLRFFFARVPGRHAGVGPEPRQRNIPVGAAPFWLGGASWPEPGKDLLVNDSELRADCRRCAGLCCVALAFDRSALFALDKPAGAPCPHLTRHDRCAIHAARAERGYAGCIGYDCLGAGQRITAEVFPGLSWRDHPDTARALFDAFRALRDVHELTLLLGTAKRLALSPRRRRQCDELLTALRPERAWSAAELSAFERSELPDRVREFLRSLRGAAAPLRRQTDTP